jgi:type VI secretion system protein ImpE
MDSKDLIRAGRLIEARKQLTEDVKSAPADAGNRTLLFQVLFLCGEWDKAERQLDVIATQNPKAETGVQVYKNLLHGEKERKEVFQRSRQPSFLTGRPQYLDSCFAAWDKLKTRDVEQAQELYDLIEEQRPVLSGTLNGTSFNGFMDLDITLCFFLEAFVHDRYIWIPFELLRELSIEPPKKLFDLLWIAARITTWEGLSINAYLPALYPDTFMHEDDLVKLGRMTHWTPLGGPFFKGVGQHVFQVGEEEIPILEIRDTIFKPVTQENANEKSD